MKKTKKELIKKHDNAIIGIYKITNPNKESYIGQTTNWEKRRDEDYKKLKCKTQPKIYQSLLEYGVENHKFELIEECYLSKLDQREAFYKRKFIKKYGWNKALFHRIKDGQGGYQHQETKDKIGNSNRGKPKPEGFGDKLSKDRKNIPRYDGFGENQSRLLKGKPKPEGFGDKLSKIKMGVPQPNISKALMGRKQPNISKALKGKPKPEGFGEKIRKALKGKKKNQFKNKN